MIRLILKIVGILYLGSAPGWAQGPFASFERASEAVLDDPHDLAIGPDGRLYVADKFANRITILDADSLEIVDAIEDAALFGVHDISFGPDGRAYIAATGASALVVFDVQTDPAELIFGLRGFPRTEGALAHSNGTVYVMASGVGALIAVAGTEVTGQAGGFFGAHDVAEGLDGSIWVADNNAQRLVQLNTDLEVIKVLDDAKFGFIGPRYLDVDDFGRLVVADQDAHRILLIDPETETLLGVLGDGTPGIGPNKFDDPEGVAVNANTYYFSDSNNNRIVKYVVVTN